MSDRAKINKYLSTLEKYLARLNATDANEVIKEIESHIFDVLDSKEEVGDSADINNILNGFGPPRELATQYVNHILDGSPPPKGFNTIQKIKKSVSKGLKHSMRVFGYGISIILALLGLFKIIFPEKLGVWGAEHGNSFIISFDPFIISDSREVIGWWLVPICFLLSLMIWTLTHKVMKELNTK